MAKRITGYHGTAKYNVGHIKRYNFKIREDESQWLGNGIYFFIKGYSHDSITLAKKWAIAASWDDDNGTYKYKEYSVLKCDIILSNILNLKESPGLKLFNKYREKLKKKLKINQLKSEINDFKLMEHLKDKFNINIIIADVYIKFTKERIAQLKTSKIPNCTIASVSNKKLIDKQSIEEVKKGRVKDEIK